MPHRRLASGPGKSFSTPTYLVPWFLFGVAIPFVSYFSIIFGVTQDVQMLKHIKAMGSGAYKTSFRNYKRNSSIEECFRSPSLKAYAEFTSKKN